MIVLRYLLEYTPGEIADLLDLPRGTVNSRLRRGLDRLEEIIDRERDESTDLQRELQRIQAPDELDAQRRAWPLVRAALRRARADRRGRGGTCAPLLAAAVAVVILAAAISPPGRALVGSVRDAVGTRRR